MNLCFRCFRCSSIVTDSPKKYWAPMLSSFCLLLFSLCISVIVPDGRQVICLKLSFRLSNISSPGGITSRSQFYIYTVCFIVDSLNRERIWERGVKAWLLFMFRQISSSFTFCRIWWNWSDHLSQWIFNIFRFGICFILIWRLRRFYSEMFLPLYVVKYYTEKSSKILNYLWSDNSKLIIPS